MVVIVFRSRLKPGANEDELNRLGARMFELAAAMPGFIAYNEYASADGETVTIVEFDSHKALAAWREHPEHCEAQKAGRERFFTGYRITVCDAVREYSFQA